MLKHKVISKIVAGWKMHHPEIPPHRLVKWGGPSSTMNFRVLKLPLK